MAVRAWTFFVAMGCIAACGSDSESAAGSGGDGGAAGGAGSGEEELLGEGGTSGDAGSGGDGGTSETPRDEEELLGEGWELVCKLGSCEEDPELGFECQETYEACVGRGHYPRSCRMDADRICGVFGETGPY